MSWTLFILFILIVAIQLGFGIFLSKMPKVKEPQMEGDDLPEISILICAKNEAKNLISFLPAVLNQQYPHDLWEVIVVNDASTDNSSIILKEFEKTYSHLRIINITPNEGRTLPGKKFALDRGISEARFETLLLTDADCRPSSNNWLKSFAQMSSYSANEIILGYGKYEENAGLLNDMIHWETLHTAMQYFSFARIGRPYMGVGRNLSYQKSLYKKAKQNTEFLEIYRKTASGDDDLLICAMAHSHNTGILLTQDAQTISKSPPDLKTWWHQKMRHVSSGKYYPIRIKFFLGLYAFSHTAFWLLSFYMLLFSLLFSDHKVFLFILFLFIWRNYLFILASQKWAKILGEKIQILPSVLFDFGWSIYNVFLSPYIFWKNKKQWK